MRPLLALLVLAGACRRAPPVERVSRADRVIPTARAPHVDDRAITIDGLMLREPAWQGGRIRGFVHPGTGEWVEDSHVNADAWMCWSDTRLFVAVRVFDPSPQRAFSRDDLDPHVWERETGVELMIQPGDPGDNRGYYEVQVGASGALWATRFDDYNRPVTRGPDGAMTFGHQAWNPRIERAVRIESGGMLVEFAIPWVDLASTRAMIPPRPGEVWRVNLYSFRDGQRDSLAWSPILGEGNVHRASRWGRVTFAGAP